MVLDTIITNMIDKRDNNEKIKSMTYIIIAIIVNIEVII
jgi:hypothetical protein